MCPAPTTTPITTASIWWWSCCPPGSAYDAEQVNIAYNKVKASTVTASEIASAMENVELCLTLLGIVPDLLCAPGYSQQSTVAAR